MKRDSRSRQDWRGGLAKDEQALYDSLKSWRKMRADQDGVPPYMILTNRLLAEVSKKMPQSLTALQQIHGIGSVTVERYGEEILICLRTVGEESTPSTKSEQEAKEVEHDGEKR